MNKEIKKCECKIGSPIGANGGVFCIQCGGEISEEKLEKFLKKHK